MSKPNLSDSLVVVHAEHFLIENKIIQGTTKLYTEYIQERISQYLNNGKKVIFLRIGLEGKSCEISYLPKEYVRSIFFHIINSQDQLPIDKRLEKQIDILRSKISKDKKIELCGGWKGLCFKSVLLDLLGLKFGIPELNQSLDYYCSTVFNDGTGLIINGVKSIIFDDMSNGKPTYTIRFFGEGIF